MFDAFGNYTRIHNWGQDRDNGIRILADRMDAEDNSIAQAFNVCFLRNGVVPMTGSLTMNGNAITTIKQGSAAVPSLSWELDPATGFYQPAIKQLAISVNGVRKVLFTEAGMTFDTPPSFDGGIKYSAYVASKTFEFHFTQGPANQKVQVYWPNPTRMQGGLEIVVAGGFNGAQASGYIRKKFALQQNEGGTSTMLDVAYEAHGATCQQVTIGNPTWDAGNSRWYVPIANIGVAANDFSVEVKTWGVAIAAPAQYANFNAVNTNISAVYTSDATVLPAMTNGLNAGNGALATNAVSAGTYTLLNLADNARALTVKGDATNGQHTMETNTGSLGIDFKALYVGGSRYRFYPNGMATPAFSILSTGMLMETNGLPLTVNSLNSNTNKIQFQNAGAILGNLGASAGGVLSWDGAIACSFSSAVTAAGSPFTAFKAVMLGTGAGPAGAYQYGGYFDCASANNAAAGIGVYAIGKQNVGNLSEGVWGEAGIVNSDVRSCGVHGKSSFNSDASYSSGYVSGNLPVGVYGEVINSAGTTNTAISCAGMFQNKSTKSAYAFGGYFSTVAGPANCDIIRCEHAGSLKFYVSGTLNVAGPGVDNLVSAGASGNRYSVVYAATGTINTSDATEKRDIRPLTDAELAAARDIAKCIRVYQWNEGTRLHVGVIAQEVWAVMTEHGLVSSETDSPYAFLCWDEVEVDGELQGRYGVRYDELNLFIAAAQEQRLEALEAKVP